MTTVSTTIDLDLETMARDLEEALENREFQLVYQPVLCTRNCRAVGAEALLRWLHPVWGDLSPRIFFPVAETAGLTRELTRAIFDTLCRQGADWIMEGLPPLELSANVSAAQLRDTDLPELVAEAIHRTGFPAERLGLEISETVLEPEIPGIDHVVAGLKEQGLSIIMDDFGQQRGCLGALRRIGADAVKITAALTRDGAHDRHACGVIHAMRTYGDVKGCRMVVKGVENDRQIAFVHQHGIEFVQGYRVCRPLDADDFRHWIEEWGDRCPGQD